MIYFECACVLLCVIVDRLKFKLFKNCLIVLIDLFELVVNTKNENDAHAARCHLPNQVLKHAARAAAFSGTFGGREALEQSTSG